MPLDTMVCCRLMIFKGGRHSVAKGNVKITDITLHTETEIILEADRKQTGSRLKADCKKTGSVVEIHWKRTGNRLGVCHWILWCVVD